MIDKEKNKAVIAKFWESVQARDIEAYLALFTAQAIAHDPVNKPPLRSSDARRAYMQGVFDSFTTIKASVDYITTCGNRTANKWTVLGTTADGTEVTIDGIDIAKHDDSGLIDEIWGYFDN